LNKSQNDSTFINTHPTLSYFILTFVISWAGVLILGAPYGMPAPSEQFEKLWPIVFLPYIFGPCIVGILMTALVYGKEGIRKLFSRWGKWQVSPGWYAFAILTVPLLVLLILFPLAQGSPEFLPGIFTTPDKANQLVMGLVVGLFFGGFLEEMGWTGFAIPEMRKSRSIISTGLIVGFLWGLWHFLPTYWGSGDPSGTLSVSLLLPPCIFYAGVLPAYRVLMVWAYDRTESLPVAMLMHASLTANTLFILAPAAVGRTLAIYYVVLTAVMWVLVAVIVKPYKRT
jgi:membrane protease YdiL (CAAX protease family)